MKKILVAIALILGLGVVVTLVTPAVQWDGVVGRRVVVKVTDSQMKPIEGAQIMLLKSIDERLERVVSWKDFCEQLQYSKRLAVSNSDGTGTLLGQFGAGGSTLHVGRFSVGGTLLIICPGYASFQKPLEELTDKKSYSLWKTSLNVIVQLDSIVKAEQGAAANP